MFLRGSRGDREEARRGEAQGQPRGHSGPVCGGGFFGLYMDIFGDGFWWVLWV